MDNIMYLNQNAIQNILYFVIDIVIGIKINSINKMRGKKYLSIRHIVNFGNWKVIFKVNLKEKKRYKQIFARYLVPGVANSENFQISGKGVNSSDLIDNIWRSPQNFV
jgi:hypothetical protein